MYRGIGEYGEGGLDGGEGGQLEAGYTLCWDTGSSVVSSLSVRNRHNPQGGSRQLLAAVWHHIHSY